MSIVFDPSTGETHFLSELPALLLKYIDANPVTVSEMFDRIAGSDSLDAEKANLIEESLTALVRAELVESCSTSA
jgi:elongation factor P--beta-lysine ligase